MPAISRHRLDNPVARVLGRVSLAAAMTASTVCAAQAVTQAAPLTAPAPAPTPEFATAAPPRGPAPLAAATAPANAQGTVARFLTNPDGNVDGLLTRDGTLVHFPPHLGAQLTSAVRPGDDVQISGSRDAGGAFAAQRITDMRSGQQVLDQPPLPGTQPPPDLRGSALSRLNAQGQVAHVTTTPRGEPDGVILADGTVIRMTPPVAQQFPALMQTGAKVAAQGYGTRTQYGTALQATAFGSPGKLTPLYDRAPPAP